MFSTRRVRESFQHIRLRSFQIHSMAVALLDFHPSSESFTTVDHWSCPTCTADNPFSAYPICAVCQESNPQPLEDLAITAHRTRSIWQCPRCTLHNDIAHQTCSACGLSKETSVSCAFYTDSPDDCSRLGDRWTGRCRCWRDEAFVCPIVVRVCHRTATHRWGQCRRHLPSDHQVLPQSIAPHIDFRDIAQ